MEEKIKVDPEIYAELEHREHIYVRPDTYIGSPRSLERQEWIMRYSIPEGIITPSVKDEMIHVPAGLERLFVEILANAGDNVIRSKERKLKPSPIIVFMDRTRISVKNGGLPIPIEKNKKGNYPPDLIFGKLLTGSNFTDERSGSGRNGYGAKLTNIFSKEFTVEIGDSGYEKHYKCTWTNNMLDKGESEIEDYKGENYVKIDFLLDFEVFKFEEYTDECFYLFARLCMDVAYTLKVPVVFNNYRFEFTNPENYGKFYFTEINKGLLFYLWPEDVKLIKRGNTYISVDPAVQPVAEIFLIDTNEENHVISFVNGLMTRDDGVHVTALMKILSKGIIDFMKKDMTPPNSKKGIKDKDKDDKNQRFPLTIADIKGSISMIANFYLKNPEYTSQSKTNLSSPEPKFQFQDEIIDIVLTWGLMDRLYNLIQMKADNKNNKAMGKKRRHIGVTKADECNFAGTDRSEECTLILFEGKSAQAYGKVVRSIMPDGNDFIGLFPLRGKVINALNSTKEKLDKNKEIIELERVLGLQERIDYSLPDSLIKLRYGRILIATDADVDGSHIKGLVINYLYTKFKSLFSIENGFVFELKIPLIKIIKGKNNFLKFYSENAYKEFIAKNPEYSKYESKYFKGLGTSTNDDIKDDFKDPKYICMNLDELAPQNIQLAFEKRFSDNRKEWMNSFVHVDLSPDLKIKDISDFINHELIVFSLENVRRSIPAFADGLKVSQRKALWTAITHVWKNLYNVKDVKTFKDYKVAQFASAVAKESRYHHGEESLNALITKMAQTFVGSNNMNHFVPIGQFGTRDMYGKDAAAPRYIFTKPNWWIRYIYRDEDNPILTYRTDEGYSIEPEVYYPIIPMALINGARGIGTGHSTRIPCHDPLGVVKWLKYKINGQNLPDVFPWYRGFRGDLEIIDARRKKKIIINNENRKIHTADFTKEDLSGESDEDDELDAYDSLDKSDSESSEEKENKEVDVELRRTRKPRPGPKLYTKGSFEVYGKGILTHELPIERTAASYKRWLEDLVSQRKIKDFNDYCDIDTQEMSFEIIGFERPTIKNLKLSKSFPLSNMVLLSENDVPKKYANVEDILEQFYKDRVVIYQKRKDYQLIQLEIQLERVKAKLLFVTLVKDEKIIIFENKTSRKKAEIYLDMDKYNLEHDLLSGTSALGFTREAISDLENKIANIDNEIETLKSMTPEKIWYQELCEFETAYRSIEIPKKINVVKKSKK